MKSPVFLFRLLLAALLYALLPTAHAGTISFGMSLTGTQLTVTNQGNSTAFYPAVFRLLADGRWQQLALPPGAKQPAELPPGAKFDLVWPETRAPETLPPLESLRPAMVRFFDQAGAGFGQISFFTQPQPAADTLDAGYRDGKLVIKPPAGNTIRATWLIWPQEEGILPLDKPLSFEHRQPNARRIEWRAGMGRQDIDLGAGLPAYFLLHETASGLQAQSGHNGGIQGRQQRAAWLNASPYFYRVMQIAGIAAFLLMVWSWTAKRNREDVI